MAEKFQICVITTDDKKTASNIALGLVENKLAACVSTAGNIKSIYRWEGEIEEANELLLIVKTRKSLSKKVINFVKARHNYSNPEILFFDITGGNQKYLAWLGQNTKES